MPGGGEGCPVRRGDRLQAKGQFLGRRELLFRPARHAGEIVGQGGDAGVLLAKMEFGGNWVWVASHADISGTFS